MSKAGVIKLRNRLKNDLQIIQTLDLLKQIAVSEYRHLENERNEAARFLEILNQFFDFYRTRQLTASKIFYNTSDVRMIISISADEGFAGILDGQIVEKTMELYRQYPDSRVLVLGRRGARRLTDLGVTVQEMPGVPFPLGYEAVLPLKNLVMDLYLRNQIGKVSIVYAHCKSMTHQTVETDHLLPFDAQRVVGVADPSIPKNEVPYVLVEPSVRKIFEYTMALWFGRRLYELFWDSKLSEVGSRAIELEERHSTLSRTHTRTRYRYFRVKREVIDSGIREVFSSHHFSQKAKEREAAS